MKCCYKYNWEDEKKKPECEKKEPKCEKKKPEEAVSIKHDKEGLSIRINIYNTNNLANQGGNAGTKQKAETGGQISGKDGENANQGGQIADKCGQNANQDGTVESEGCSCAAGDEDELIDEA